MRRLLAIAVFMIAARAEADEPAAHTAHTAHTVKAGDTCAALAQHYYGDARLVDVIHRANPALAGAPPPHVLREGTVLVIPPRPTGGSSPDAQLTTVRNRVDVITPETKRGKPNDPLFRGNRVSTEEASAADVTFRDETQVKLGERTLVIILGDARSAAAVAGEIETSLVTGNLRAWMTSTRKLPVAVATPAASVRIKGEAQVSSDAAKTTRLAVYAGSSTIESQGKTREVTPGFGSKAEFGKQPTVPRPLPLAPVWTRPPDRVLIDGGSGAGAIVGAYAEGDPAVHVAEWRVQLARDDVFREVLVDTHVESTTHRFEAASPGPGHYWVRVSAVDDDHFEGPFGIAARVLVVRPRKTTLSDGRRRIEVEPPDAACMRVGNVRLTWVKRAFDVSKHEPVTLRCAPAETDPTTLVPIDP